MALSVFDSVWLKNVCTLVPILSIVLLMTWKRASVDFSGIVGWLLTLLVAILLFHTSIELGLRASLDGIIRSFPVSLMVVTSLLQISFMEATGALKRVTVFIKTLASADQAVQIMLINVGAGTLLVAVGATPVSILPPIMLALGYSTFVAVALPAIGFDALCTFALLGAPLVLFSDLTHTSLVQSAQICSMFLPVISTLIGFGMLWIVGRMELIKKGFLPCLLAGVTNGGVAIIMSHLSFMPPGSMVLIGVVAGACTMLMMLLYLKLTGKPIIDRSVLTAEDLKTEKSMSLGTALSPWTILVVACFAINFIPPLYKYLSVSLAMPVSIIQGQVIPTRMLWNAYTWVLISTALAAIFIRPSSEAWKSSLSKWVKRAPRPFVSAAIFFAIAFVMNNSGYQFADGTWTLIEKSHNMIWVIAHSSADAFGKMYPFISGFMGLFGGFISGSESSTIGMFFKYHNETSQLLHVSPLIVTAATAIGGGLASVISPAKLQNAAATIDALGIEGEVIKTAFIISLLMTLVASIMAMFLA